MIKVGIIGVGGEGAAHLEAVLRLGVTRVEAVCRPDKENLDECAKRYGIPKAYTDYKTLIDESGVDVVHIATPNFMHYEQAKYALEAGKHVICEKPLGVNRAQTYELVQLAAEKKLANAVCYNHRFFPYIYHAREMVKRGDVGDPTFIRAYAMGDFMLSIFTNDPGHWRTSSETVGRSKTMSVYGGHLVDLLQFVTGRRIKRLLADFCYIGGVERSQEDHVNMLVDFGDGLRGNVALSEAAPGHKCEMFFEIVGTSACIAWDLQNVNQLWVGFHDKPNQLMYKDPDLLYPEAKEIAGPPDWAQDGFANSLRHLFNKFYKYVIEGKYLKGVKPDFPDFEIGLNMEDILDAMMASKVSKSWESVGKHLI